MAAVAIVQVKAATASATNTVTATLAPAATANNRLIAFVNFADGPVANITGPTGFTDLNLDVQATALGPACAAYEKLAAGGETTITATVPAGSHTLQIVVYELSGVTIQHGIVPVGSGCDQGANSSTSGSSHTSEVQGQVAINGNATSTLVWTDEMMLVFEGLGNTGGAASLSGSWVLDVSPGVTAYAGHLYAGYATSGISLLLQVTVTWTTARTNSCGIILSVLGSSYDWLPTPITQNRHHRGRAPRRGTTIRRTFGGTPSMHDVRIERRKRPTPRPRRPDFLTRIPGGAPPPADLGLIQAKRRRNFRRDRPSLEWFDPTQQPSTPPPIVLNPIVRSLRARGFHERRGLVISFPFPTVVTTPPGIILELIRARQRPRFKYTQRHGLFIYPIPPQTPPITDPIVIEPIRGFLLTDGKTTGLLLTDGHTTGFLLSDGKTSTVLLS